MCSHTRIGQTKDASRPARSACRQERPPATAATNYSEPALSIVRGRSDKRLQPVGRCSDIPAATVVMFTCLPPTWFRLGFPLTNSSVSPADLSRKTIEQPATTPAFPQSCHRHATAATKSAPLRLHHPARPKTTLPTSLTGRAPTMQLTPATGQAARDGRISSLSQYWA
jgi:hypothetical protein